MGESKVTEKFYGLKYDIVFKKLFVEHNDLLKEFISDMLDIPFEEIGEVVVENPDLIPDEVDGKYSRLDIRANISKQIINIEMQVAGTESYDKRAMYYWSGIYHGQLKKGQSYSELKKTVSMNILAYNQFAECEDYHSKYVLYDVAHKSELPDILELHFFEIQKAMEEQSRDKKHLWLKLINAESTEDLDNLAGNSSEKFVQKGVKAVGAMNANTDFKTIVRMREEAMLEKISQLKEAEKKGKNEGRIEGLTEGMEKAAAFMRNQGLPEEIIQKYLASSDTNNG